MLRASVLVPFPRFARQVSHSASDFSARPTSLSLRSRTALAAHVPSAACRGASVGPRLQRQLRSRCPTFSVSWQDSLGGFARPRGSVFHCTAVVLVEFGLTSQSRGTYIVRCTTHVPLSPALGPVVRFVVGALCVGRETHRVRTSVLPGTPFPARFSGLGSRARQS